MASRSEILADCIGGLRPAVANIAAAVCDREHEATNFGCKRMMLAVAGRLQPQNLPCRVCCRERVQHRENRRGPYSRAEHHHRPLAGLENETSAGRADIESITHP